MSLASSGRPVARRGRACGKPLRVESGGADGTVRSTAAVTGVILLIRESDQAWVAATGSSVGHGLAGRVADELLQAALGRRHQVVAADRGRGFGGEDTWGEPSVSFDQHVGPDRRFAPRPRRDKRPVR